MDVKHSRTSGRSWLVIAGEGLAIVASILLAFAIDAWWDERGLRIEEQQVLRGLRADFRSVRDVLSDHMATHQADLNALKNFLATAEGTSVETTGPIVDAVVLELLSPMTSDLGVGTLDALLGSGRIEILASRELRAKLAAWEGVINEVWDDQESNAKMVYEINIPYFLAAGIPAGASMHRWYPEWPLSRKSPSDDPEMVAKIFGDETFREMVALRYGYKRHTSQEFEIAMIAVDEILSEIESSIDAAAE